MTPDAKTEALKAARRTVLIMGDDKTAVDMPSALTTAFIAPPNTVTGVSVYDPNYGATAAPWDGNVRVKRRPLPPWQKHMTRVKRRARKAQRLARRINRRNRR